MSPAPLTEAEFQRAVIHLARLYGWKVQHSRPAIDRSGRWSTPITGDRGFPDLVLCHRTRGTIFAELKSSTGRPSPEQVAWLEDLRASGIEAYLLRPSDLDWIARRLMSVPSDAGSDRLLETLSARGAITMVVASQAGVIVSVLNGGESHRITSERPRDGLLEALRRLEETDP